VTAISAALGICALYAQNVPSGQTMPSAALSVEAAFPAAMTPHAMRDDYLILVNSENPISDDAPDFEIVSAYRVVPVRTSDIALERETLGAVAGMFRAAKEAGIDNLLVNDGFRSHEAQRRIYEETADKTLVQAPGHSEHQTGLAADIAVSGVAGSVMGESAEGKWLAENAWKYGLILRYPQGKREVTGIAYEPWHFRYVGVENAKNIRDSGLCLEEYLDSAGK
jgi:D-alanyl-D-alanine carboxypeptidase